MAVGYFAFPIFFSKDSPKLAFVHCMLSVFVSLLPFDGFDFSKTFTALLDVEFAFSLLLAWF
jgi:hypothetical protein